MKIAKQRLLDLGLPYECEGGEILSSRMVRHKRWAVVYAVVFQLPEQVGTDRALLTHYEQPATECQEVDWPYEYAPDEIELVELERREVTITSWAPLDLDGKYESLTL